MGKRHWKRFSYWVPVRNEGETPKGTATASKGKHAGQPCPPGVTAKRSGCIPKSGRGVAPKLAKGKGADIAGIIREKKTPPPPGKSYDPNVEKTGKDGITLAARIGVPANSVPPPPNIAPLPNLNPDERQVEKEFVDAFHADPEGMAAEFRKICLTSGKTPPEFGTDDAKVLSSHWSHPDPDQRAINRSTLNLSLHQAANAIAKRAFLQHLDTLDKGDQIMVTVGGCGAGKGFALKKVDQALALKNKCQAVWDSAGDQNATENPWIQKEAEKRGLKVNYVYVHADPATQWADPERGVVKRAGDPADGRMVDAKVFADSYALGARNHQAFYEANKDNPNASFMFLKNDKTPIELPGIPREALLIDRKALAKFAEGIVEKVNPLPRIKRGALIGRRVWKKEK